MSLIASLPSHIDLKSYLWVELLYRLIQEIGLKDFENHYGPDGYATTWSENTENILNGLITMQQSLELGFPMKKQLPEHGAMASHMLELLRKTALNMYLDMSQNDLMERMKDPLNGYTEDTRSTHG